MRYVPPELRRTIYDALDAFGAAPRGTTAFARYWNAVGHVEDYAAIARTRAEQALAVMMRLLLEKELRRSAPYDALHPDARGVEEFLGSPPWRPRRK